MSACACACRACMLACGHSHRAALHRFTHISLTAVVFIVILSLSPHEAFRNDLKTTITTEVNGFSTSWDSDQTRAPHVSFPRVRNSDGVSMWVLMLLPISYGDHLSRSRNVLGTYSRIKMCRCTRRETVQLTRKSRTWNRVDRCTFFVAWSFPFFTGFFQRFSD